MRKLIKYEFIKILNAVIGVLGAALLLEATYGIGAVLMKFNTFDDFDGTYEEYLDSAENVLYSVGSQMFSFSAVLLVLAAFSAVIFVVVFSIVTMNNDFCKKQGYNVFLTPNSSYAILGAKYITSFIIFLLFGIIAFLLAIADINISMWLYDYDYLSIVDDVIKPLLEALDVDLFASFIGIASQLIFYIFLAGFTLVFTHAVLKASGALKVILQFIVFGVANAFTSIFYAMVIGAYYSTKAIDMEIINICYISTAVYLTISAVLYFVTAKLIEKKLSI